MPTIWVRQKRNFRDYTRGLPNRLTWNISSIFTQIYPYAFVIYVPWSSRFYYCYLRVLSSFRFLRIEKQERALTFKVDRIVTKLENKYLKDRNGNLLNYFLFFCHIP